MTIFTSTQSFDIPENLSVPQFVLQNAASYGSKPCLVDSSSGFTITYEQLVKFVFVISKNLRETYNFNKGSVLAIYLPNHPMYAALLFGTLSSGATVTTINPLYTVDELRKQLQDSGATLIVTLPLFLDKALEATKDTNIKTVFLLSADPVKAPENASVPVLDVKTLLAPPKDMNPVPVQINPKEDIAILPYSSGTTGLSKGVVLTHYNLIANLVQINSVESLLVPEDKIVGVLPFFHIYGMTVILNKAVSLGVTIVTMPKFEFPDFLKLIQEHKITKAHLVPPILLALAKHPLVDKFDLSSLKDIVSGAAPLSSDLQLAVSKRLNAIVRIGYGLTESSPVLAVQQPDCLSYPGSTGPLVANTELKVVDISNGELLGPNKEGELCFRGPQIMKGYLNNPEATKVTIDEQGFLHTGDVGYVDEKGHMYIVDRVKELIKFKGFQVPPAELEGILLKHESIADAAVVGVPDDEAGELPKAYVVLKPDHKLSAEDVMAFVAEKVAPYKKLRFVEFTDVIPKSASGKILRRILKLKEREAAEAKKQKLE